VAGIAAITLQYDHMVLLSGLIDQSIKDPSNGVPLISLRKMERFADTETGTGFTLTRETVRDASTTFALLTALSMTERLLFIEVICRTSHSKTLYGDNDDQGKLHLWRDQV
jgi:hypothetical protein